MYQILLDQAMNIQYCVRVFWKWYKSTLLEAKGIKSDVLFDYIGVQPAQLLDKIFWKPILYRLDHHVGFQVLCVAGIHGLVQRVRQLRRNLPYKPMKTFITSFK